ncbi:methyltransferase domain-containing protein [Aeromonas salmonicida]|uniref:class I SAM-dependent methyltransferase n=1 Tax=Aeromonas salmonicida TaxID=645 RepID=UPI0009364E6F|nr:methyltransferase domain-containing protein [Aeromonas salmonicida]MCK3679921.1 methyltransferase domain-containing protein [Aeromonas salmonicida subsp. salmonicida]MCR4455109.1 methyltransferase domain-containing protein [Aeromonas salmonicida]UDQ58137.1 methyltransferase domain-containing protein [Aeromonas salmonicida subsp. salmonicida]UYZ29979.1 methyltransferase domain-containing protein [Aeromonas salmonicida subsp. salmonicida]WCB50444.1 methyltransferase domain-containing protein 
MSISPLPNYDASPSHDASSSLPSVADPGTLSARQRFLKQLAAGAHLLEAGCGAGEDLLFFRQQGFMVTAIDASLAQAKLASRRCVSADSSRCTTSCPLTASGPAAPCPAWSRRSLPPP